MGKPGARPLLVPDPAMVTTDLQGNKSTNTTFRTKNREVNLKSYSPLTLPESHINGYQLSAQDRTLRILSTIGNIETITPWESEHLD